MYVLYIAEPNCAGVGCNGTLTWLGSLTVREALLSVEGGAAVCVVRQSWVRHCSSLELSDIVLYLVRIQLMHRLLLKWFS